MSASISQKVAIGNDSIIGAQSFVKSDIPPNVIANGVPVRTYSARGDTDTFF